MPHSVKFPLGIVYRREGSGLLLARCLFFPELSRLGRRRSSLERTMRHNLAKLLREQAPGQLHLRRRTIEAERLLVPISIEPPERSSAWRTALNLRYCVFLWTHEANLRVAWVPDLDLELLIPGSDDPVPALRSEIHAYLSREQLGKNLYVALNIPCEPRQQLEWVPLDLKLPTLLQQHKQREAEAELQQKPELNQVSTHLEASTLTPAFNVEETVLQLTDAFTSPQPRSVLLVGPSGVGKTAAFHEFVRQSAALQLGQTVFYETSGARIVAGMSGFGMWQERCQKLWREAAKLKAILHLGSLVELMHVGKSECQHTGIAGFFRPFMARGDFLVICECTPEQIPLIERDEPSLLQVFRQIPVPEPDHARGRQILEHTVDHLRKSVPKSPLLSPTALDAIDRLHRRYATYSAYPGRPIRFLRNLLQDAQVTPDSAAPVSLTEDAVLTAFTRETGFPRVLLDPAQPLDLEATRQWFTQRVMGQPEAIDFIVNLLATIKAGLTRPQRPIASLLFIGPTGVGKTEMAKTLAEFLFGSQTRLTRLDMSEYADPVAAQRLTGITWGGERGSEGVLTARVREQPFLVLLLDEFEKAHPACFDLLLQMLGEARLTDAGGRLADFRNAVIILTSNLGAESYQQGSFGFDDGPRDLAAARDHFTRAVQRFLRPEIFNRIDRIVPFAPLDATTVRTIADKELRAIEQRDGVRYRPLDLHVDPAVLEHLAAKGFDVRYGARPLKRAMERQLLAPLSHAVNRYAGNRSLEVKVQRVDEELNIQVQPRKLDDPQRRDSLTTRWGRLLSDVAKLRRWHQLLGRSSIVRELDNDDFQLQRLEKQLRRRKGQLRRSEQYLYASLGRSRVLREAVHDQIKQVERFETELLVQYYQEQEIALADPAAFQTRLEQQTEQLAVLTRQWDRLLFRLYDRDNPASDQATLILFGERRSRLELALAYSQVCRDLNYQVHWLAYQLPTNEDREAVKQIPRPALVQNPGVAVASEGEEVPLVYRWVDDLLLARLANKTSEDVVLCRTPVMETTELLDELASHASGDGEEDWTTYRQSDPERFATLKTLQRSIGLGLAIQGEAAGIRFMPEAGLHQFKGYPVHGEGDSVQVLVQTHPTDLSDTIAPPALTRRGKLDEYPLRRVYRLAASMVDDARLEQHVPFYHRSLPKLLAETSLTLMRATLQQMVLE